MKQKNILFIFFVALSAVFACERVDESRLEGNDSTLEKVEMTFSAVIDREGDTKTVLDGELGDGVRKVLWQPGDEIGVNPDYGNTYEISKFTADISSLSETAEFKGGAPLWERYKAFYPYQEETLRDSMNYFIFNLPTEQKYVRNTFDPKAAPMTATAAYGETFQFRNLCGVLALQLKGEETVKSITFKAIGEDGSLYSLAGDFEVNPSVEGNPEIRLHGNGRQFVKLICESPVELDSEIATAFYFVLPPATYHKFNITIETEDGQIMMKEGTKPLTIKRADVQPTAALQYVETVAIDLSEHGNANCYIVPGAGLYSFDASVIGNGIYGMIEDAAFHTSDPAINPASAEILWQDRVGVIDNLQFDASLKQVRLMASGRKGNAVIAAKDENGTILWSWHIWATDTPVDQNYVNSVGEFTVMDRNLGAIRADRGENDQWRGARGTIYQWGRKDPMYVYRFPWGESEMYTRNQSRVSIAEAIQNPMVFEGNGFRNWNKDDNPTLWSETQKTIYDPCPVGYRMSTKDIWKGFTITGNAESGDSYYYNVSGSYENGWMFYINNSELSYYPSTYLANDSGYLDTGNNRIYLWSANHSQENHAYVLDVWYDNDINSGVMSSSFYKTNALQVRCMKDENHVDLSYPTVNISDITDVTTETATVHVSLANDGSSAVTARGIIWGTQSGLTLETGKVISEPQDLHEFTVALSGLQHSTRYYVRAYATNERGTGYSKEMSFYTPFSGEAFDLSADGTANCYIVPPVFSEYSFDASVKGNSEESVGQIASVEVLWETRNNNNNIKAKSVISSVELKGNRVHFQLPFDVKPGNALIAVKDALGTILWSWHIWVVDFDPIETQQTYISGAVMMDRNLGALKVMGDVTSHGLIYYWGRKDPFPSPVSSWEFASTAPENVVGYIDNYNTYEYSIQNPTTVLSSGGWNDSYTNWGDSKTMYDPCPAGWRVPSLGVWNKIEYSGSTIPEPFSTPAAYYPPTGYVRGTEICEFNYFSYVYSSTSSESSSHAYLLRIPEYWTGAIDKDYGLAVRCMKDIAGVSGGGNDYVVDDEFVWE